MTSFPVLLYQHVLFCLKISGISHLLTKHAQVLVASLGNGIPCPYTALETCHQLDSLQYLHNCGCSQKGDRKHGGRNFQTMQYLPINCIAPAAECAPDFFAACVTYMDGLNWLLGQHMRARYCDRPLSLCTLVISRREGIS